MSRSFTAWGSQSESIGQVMLKTHKKCVTGSWSHTSSAANNLNHLQSQVRSLWRSAFIFICLLAQTLRPWVYQANFYSVALWSSADWLALANVTHPIWWTRWRIAAMLKRGLFFIWCLWFGIPESRWLFLLLLLLLAKMPQTRWEFTIWSLHTQTHRQLTGCWPRPSPIHVTHFQGSRRRQLFPRRRLICIWKLSGRGDSLERPRRPKRDKRGRCQAN